MKAIVFDTSTIISLATNNLLWILEPLRKQMKGKFYIPEAVKKEVIDRPLQSYRFKLEAMQVLQQVIQGTLNIYESKGLREERERILNLANSIFIARGKNLHIAHEGEIGAIALARILGADVIAIDERTTRVLVEQPLMLVNLLSGKLHTKIMVNQENLREFNNLTSGMKVVRSVELGMIAYQIGLMDKYAAEGTEKYVSNHPKKYVLEGLLWALKLKGCSVSESEIDQMVKLSGFDRL
ncbi:MAG: hypothetical protein ABIB71_05335 [Candidatus Woesearchaeota archaeon]